MAIVMLPEKEKHRLEMAASEASLLLSKMWVADGLEMTDDQEDFLLRKLRSW